MPHPRLTQPLGQAVEVGVLPLDEDLFRLVNVVRGNGRGLVCHEYLGELASQRIDKPGLPLRQVEGPRRRVGREGLPRLIGVLLVERGNFVSREVAERNGLGFDIEGTGGVEPFAAPRCDFVIAHVAQANERERPGEEAGRSA